MKKISDAPKQDQAGANSLPDPKTANSDATDDLELVVTEAPSGDPELVGGFEPESDGDLPLESTSDWMESDSRPSVPAPAEDASLGDGAALGSAAENEDMPALGAHHPPVPDQLDPEKATSRIEKLSEDRVRELNSQMGGSTDYLSEAEKMRLISSIDVDAQSPANAESSPGEPPAPAGFDNQPIVPPKKDSEPALPPDPDELSGEQPPMSGRVRGIAHFSRGYIKVAGEQGLREGDELVINGREYSLRKMRFNNHLLIGTLAVAAAVILFAVAAWFTADSNIGQGRVVGMILDEFDQPVITGAAVRFPQDGQTVAVNAQGFFITDLLESGSYQIEYLIDGELIGSDYATVVDGRVTTTVLRPQAEAPSSSGRSSQPAPQKLTAQAPPTAPAPKAESSAKPTKAKKRASSPPAQWSQLTLAANVDGARLTIDGTVVGAGNLTYSKLKPGSHQYTVSKKGYQTSQGTIDLKASESGRLEITLAPLNAEEKRRTFDEQDYYNSALAGLDRQDPRAAMADLTAALELKPDYLQARLKRAEVSGQTGDTRTAHDDYVHAAVTLRMQGSVGQAMTSFDKAINIYPKSQSAYLGRGELHLARGEQIAAVADFDMVVRLNKKNPDGHLGLGRARFNQGNYKKAIGHFKDARSINSKTPTPHRWLTASYFKSGNTKQAKKSYEKFLKYASEKQLVEARKNQSFAAAELYLKR